MVQEPLRELTIQQVAEDTGISVHTLRYYEKAGLLAPIPRSMGGHRRYSENDVAFLLFLARLRSTGMPIQKVKQYADMARAGEFTSEARMNLLVEHRDSVLSQIAELQRNLAAIEFKIDLYGSGWRPCEDGNDPVLRELRRLCTNQEENE